MFVGFKKAIPKSISQHHPASWGLMFTSQFYGLDFRRIQNVDKDPSGYVNMCVSVFLDKFGNHVRSVCSCLSPGYSPICMWNKRCCNTLLRWHLMLTWCVASVI